MEDMFVEPAGCAHCESLLTLVVHDHTPRLRHTADWNTVGLS